MENQQKEALLEEFFSAGVHYGFAKGKRHPSIQPHVYGQKNTIDILNIEDTISMLSTAEQFLAEKAATGKKIVFIGNKKEAQDPAKEAALRTGMPYVANRWIGGTFTNFKEIRSRVAYLEKLIADRDSGELATKYTKREQGKIKLEIEKLLANFDGIRSMSELPKVIVVIDPRFEHTCIREAQQMGIVVVAIAGSDCNILDIDYPIVANDAAPSSIKMLVGRLADAVAKGLEQVPAVLPEKEKTLSAKEEKDETVPEATE
ncbi:MAG: 30S ribosomal protein S2 [bacterium]|nr:30S ribosomal protein S2 [bacterium]